MEASINLAQFFGEVYRPTNRATAIQTVQHLQQDYGLATINNLRNTFGILFEIEFWERLAYGLRKKTAHELVPIRVNPQMVMASQPYVNAEQVKTFLTMPPPQFGRLVKGTGDPANPVILLGGMHGFITINGHHRMRTLQLLNIRVAQVHAIPATEDVSLILSQLLREFGYIDINPKRMYIRL